MSGPRPGHPPLVQRQQVMWRVVGSASGIVAGAAARRLLQLSWRAVRGTEPPTNPASPRTTWREALMWTAAMGVTLGLARLAAQRAAAEAWRHRTGDYPEGLETVSP